MIIVANGYENTFFECLQSWDMRAQSQTILIIAKILNILKNNNDFHPIL